MEYAIAPTDKAVLLVYDITGKTISNYYLNASENKININENRLDNGVYLYEIKVNGKTVQSDKLIIIK
ncbi:MAG: T9SS type A sorting domain-containing protein [Bacteroidetes bacterium]|nr:T9SS type A sorting domain-containing protein [Bacteroidota bacterium]